MRKVYKNSPLPFQGQKRYFIKEFSKQIASLPDSLIYIDLFGGSGLLSHTVKSIKPAAKVVYNDYDDFNARLEAIPTTNAILHQIRLLFAELKSDEKVPREIRQQVIELISSYGDVDYLTLSSSVLYGGKYATSIKELKKHSFYNACKQNDYNADGYLDGIDVVRCDYKELYNVYKDKPNVVFIADPPYLSTDCSSYGTYWKLKDYLDIIPLMTGAGNYIFFTSDKSHLVELCDWATSNFDAPNPFSRAKIYKRVNPMSNTLEYTDMMLVKIDCKI